MIKIEKGIASVTDGERVLVVDRSGRLLIYSNGRETFRRSLFNQFLKVGYRDGERNVALLNERDAKLVALEAYDFLREFKADLSFFIPNIDDLGWDFLLKDSERLFKIYKSPVPIVPPDQYFPVYIQITVGCAWNRCTFCHLYRDQRYSVVEEKELIEMIKGLIDYFGPSLPSRRSVFIGDANALLIDHERLLKYLKIINNVFNLPIYSFVDAFLTPEKLRNRDLETIKKLGVERVYFGVESGSEKVLKLLNKPMKIDEAVEFINSFKNSGMNVGLIFLAGAGGKEYWEEHVKKSSEFVSRIELDRKDIIYVSPLHEYRDLPYWNTSERLGRLRAQEKLKQFREMKQKIREKYLEVNQKDLQAPVVLYDITESVY
ncbi:MAG: radical SAM protein [Nitrososphaeria archaeon]